jgi:hypothetical protein
LLNETLIATRVLEQVGALESDLPFSRIISQIPTAIDRLAERIAQGEMPEWVDSLRKEFTVTATGGEADISALFAPDQGLIPTSLHLANIFQGTNARESEWLPDRKAVTLMARKGFPVVAREGARLIFGDANGGVGTLNASVKIRGLAIPVSSGVVDIPKPVESAFLNDLAQIVSGPQQEAA